MNITLFVIPAVVAILSVVAIVVVRAFVSWRADDIGPLIRRSMVDQRETDFARAGTGSVHSVRQPWTAARQPDRSVIREVRSAAGARPWQHHGIG